MWPLDEKRLHFSPSSRSSTVNFFLTAPVSTVFTACPLIERPAGGGRSPGPAKRGQSGLEGSSAEAMNLLAFRCVHREAACLEKLSVGTAEGVKYE